MNRIGQGYDVHQIREGLPMWLCGVRVPSSVGFVAHSDGDVAIHALCDALLGALALGDIGHHFPDTSDEFAGIDSKILLRRVMAFPRWLEAQRNCYGRVILDAAPLRAAAAPGGPRRFWEGPPPERGFLCPGLGCLHRRLEDGTVLFWDTAQTLSARLAAAEVPAVVFRADWDQSEI